MKEITVGQMYDLSAVLGTIGSQQMPLEQASMAAEFIEKVVAQFPALEEERLGFLTEKDEDEKNFQLEEFASRKVEIPEISFKGFALRLTPNEVQTLKLCGLF